jgi:hypothetical protein
MRGKRGLASAIVLTAVGTLLIAGAIPAAGGGRRDSGGATERSPNGKQIVGTWQATVNRGPVLAPIASLHTFTREHTLIESGSDTLFRSPSYGVWEYVGDRTYATTMVLHRFSSAGVHVGMLRINANRRIAADGESYEGVAVNEVLDLGGNVIATGRATVTATRMHVARIPDLP